MNKACIITRAKAQKFSISTDCDDKDWTIEKKADGIIDYKIYKS